MNKLLKKKMIIIPITLAFLILILYVSYAYYNAEVSGNESVSTVAVNGGFINIDYVNNSGTISAANIIPGWETTKSFTVSSSTNFTDPSLLNNTWYDVLLVVDQNDFVTGSLEYMLTIAEEDENKEGIYKNSEYYSIPTGTNLDGIVLGSGYLPNVNISHTYNLTLRYIDSDDIDQTTDMYAKFYARVNVRGSDIATITFDLDGGTLNNFSINEQLKSRIAKNTKVYIPVPVKDDYVFAGWEIVDSSASANNNVITTNQSDITMKVLWKKLIFNFDYNGGEQEFIAQYTGYYKLETWGAQGGSEGPYIGGYGGYSQGNVYLTYNQKLYINIGGRGNNNSGLMFIVGGYNGGGNSGSGAPSGGGATHISLSSGTLPNLSNNVSSIIIVSGGGGAADGVSTISGSGGGFIGVEGIGCDSKLLGGNGGTQSGGGTPKSSGNSGSFGKGGDGLYQKSSDFSTGVDYGGAGGAGYYGGAGVYACGTGGGGSGYIGNSLLTDKYMYCYNCTTSNVEATKTYTTTCAEETPTENCAKKGNGYARITYLHN